MPFHELQDMPVSGCIVSCERKKKNGQICTVVVRNVGEWLDRDVEVITGA